MGKIEVFSKWDLEANNWRTPSKGDRFRSFAMANYDPIVNNAARNANYIIIAYGSRVEDHSKDSINIKNSSANINKLIHYFNKDTVANYIIKFVMLDADAPLKEEAKKLANYIDRIASNFNTSSINVVGLSKCGALNMYIPRYFKNSKSFSLTNIYNIATPYNGTILASPLIFYPKVKDLIISKIGDNKFANKVYEETIKFYESISSNSHQDYDIAKPWGVPQDRYDKYDPSFIENIFCDENIEALNKINSFHNYITGIDQNTLGNALFNCDFVSIGLCIIDKYFFEEKSEGLVQTSDQYLIGNYIDIQSIKLNSTHSVMTSKELNSVLNDIRVNSENSVFQRKRI